MLPRSQVWTSEPQQPGRAAPSTLPTYVFLRQIYGENGEESSKRDADESVRKPCNRKLNGNTVGIAEKQCPCVPLFRGNIEASESFSKRCECFLVGNCHCE